MHVSIGTDRIVEHAQYQSTIRVSKKIVGLDSTFFFQIWRVKLLFKKFHQSNLFIFYFSSECFSLIKHLENLLLSFTFSSLLSEETIPDSLLTASRGNKILPSDWMFYPMVQLYNESLNL